MRRDLHVLTPPVLAGWLLAALLVLGAPPASAANTPSAGVAWVSVQAEADVDRAFATARAEKKPVLLYWGAQWCPPCNQLKATLFNRQDFIERARSFVALHIDGDLPGAQKLGARFQVRGYPTLILLAPDGAELTRLPGEVDATQVMNLLQQGLAGGRPVKAVLADARAGKPLSGAEWRLLAFYAWDTDEARLVGAPQRPALLATLATAVPPTEAEAASRLLLKALAAGDEGAGGLKADARQRERVRALLADPAQARAQMDTLVNYGAELAKALAPQPGAERQGWVGAFDATLRRLQADATLSRADRLSALLSRVELARLDAPDEERAPRLPAALAAEVREHALRADREISDGYERQAVITSAAWMLARAGLWADSDALLRQNLAKSHSPHYLLGQLSDNAKKQGRRDEALLLSAKAWRDAQGPAARLQWGSSHLAQLLELAPQDEARIEVVAGELLAEAVADDGAFHQRSAARLERLGKRLAQWNADGRHEAAWRRLQARVAGACIKLEAGGPARASCEGLLKPPVT